MKKLNHKFFFWMMIALASYQEVNAMIIDEEREISRSSRSSWKNMFCCCWESKEEKANHHFKQAMEAWNNTYWDTQPAKTAMQEAAYYGHPSAPAMLKNIEDYNPISKAVGIISTGYNIYSIFFNSDKLVAGAEAVFDNKKNK